MNPPRVSRDVIRGTKKCRDCGRTKPVDAFNLSLATKGLPGARKSRCKECQYTKHREWVAENPERIKNLRARHQPRANERAIARSAYHCQTASDEYIKKSILKLDDAPADLIGAARAHLLIKRHLKDQS